MKYLRVRMPAARVTRLTAKTQGRGSYQMEFSHYDYVPSLQAEKIVAAATAHSTETDELED